MFSRVLPFVRRSAAHLSLSLIGLFCLTLPVLATPNIPTVAWSDTAIAYQTRIGEDITLYCPTSGTPTPTWGTDRYTADSSVCSAAVHAGLITLAEGGAIAIRMMPGDAAVASERNGIVTGSHSGTAASFTFTNPRDFVADVLPTTFGDLPLHPITWDTTAVSSWRQPSPIEAYYCPVGTAQPVWGNGVYSQESSLCSAAVHVGQITLSGGSIVVQRLPGQGFYAGSLSNGVRTGDRAGSGGSFRFLDDVISSEDATTP
ncbi:MAG: LCCL domain-containing protein [Elainellaceae cyanobacterium]